MMHPIWIFFLLAAIEASSIANGVEGSQFLDTSTNRSPELSVRSAFAKRPARGSMVGKIVRRETTRSTRVYRGSDSYNQNGNLTS
jgi:hypothetical protein